MNNSEIICDDYSTQFMIVREKAILEKVVGVLANLYERAIFENVRERIRMTKLEKIYLQEKEQALKEQANDFAQNAK
ncbi:hypothetical protein MH215_24030 [Paenibacillus sp. ACRSA]|uniref:hypothetical protein n=1 Tax=Paenibacillus sp. ACRSA TaxID=2918211 RepID=UPI001EF4C6F9|nr:hypothetical protein [Paenibacillus sp. ACRSA]MCG7380068.1 hypothetical protein [Paenibacillus sp. ACRSA]